MDPPSCCHVVAIPYPGRGHINAMLNLSHLLLSSPFSSRILVTLVLTEEWRALLFSDSDSARHSQPQLPVGLRIATIPNVIPSERGRAADFDGFIEAVYTKMDSPVADLLDRLDPPPAAVLADTYLPWAVPLAARRRIPLCSLFPMAATFFALLAHLRRLPTPTTTTTTTIEIDDQSLEQYIPGLTSMRLSDVRHMFSYGTLERAFEAISSSRKAQCLLFTSFYEIESKVIDLLREELQYPIFAIGPCIPYMLLDRESKDNAASQNGCATANYFTWLDSQPESSILYVSLGSFLSVSTSQLDELALGLVASKIKFLWVARDDSPRIQETVGDAGLVVPWCEQLKVLNHPSVGGFLTHCGWNSTLEALFMGVPTITLPISWDQLPDSRLMVSEWKVGLSLTEKTGEDGVIPREEIATVVRRLMDLDGNEGNELRNNALRLKEASRRAIEEGGSSFNSLESFVEGLLHKHDWTKVPVGDGLMEEEHTGNGC
ncbi:UDP-glycosyltransferase 87A2 [Ananas comosus]|uniref:Glycosyltransferase n=1 Tax=Ananas comosus TaxID=4615 RepID=A0A199VD81_ANACO|nr:UDP-glycosyltransferase 87A2 [Ananas comosus]